MLIPASASPNIWRASTTSSVETCTRLAILSRAPAAASVKTRLAATAGSAASERLFVAMIADLFANLKGIRLDCAVYLTSQLPTAAAHAAVRAASGWRGRLRQQPADELSARIGVAFAERFADRCERTLVIGTDSPQLDRALLASAERRLDAAQVVIGPAFDGGYYLIGATRDAYRAELLADIPWGTVEVLATTRARARAAHLDVTSLPPLADLDRFEDI